jgi:hypothetical protein
MMMTCRQSWQSSSQIDTSTEACFSCLRQETTHVLQKSPPKEAVKIAEEYHGRRIVERGRVATRGGTLALRFLEYYYYYAGLVTVTTIRRHELYRKIAATPRDSDSI